MFSEYAAIRADPHFRVLADYTQTTRIELNVVEVDLLARFAQFKPETKRALLVARGVVAGITAFFAAAYPRAS